MYRHLKNRGTYWGIPSSHVDTCWVLPTWFEGCSTCWRLQAWQPRTQELADSISVCPCPECTHPVHLMSSEYFSARNCANDPGNKDGQTWFPLRRAEDLIEGALCINKYMTACLQSPDGFQCLRCWRVRKWEASRKPCIEAALKLSVRWVDGWVIPGFPQNRHYASWSSKVKPVHSHTWLVAEQHGTASSENNLAASVKI